MADGEGWLELALSPACPASVTVQWGPAGSTVPYPFRRDVIPECDKGSAEHVTRARLHNIGYERSWPFELAAKCFQDDYGVDCEPEPRGLDGSQLPAATQQRLDAIYVSLDCDASTSETIGES
ncbi:MAG: hypothetical protein DRI90_27615 [Deltaproteobacteria bacterium]|nr:MAG: hypothetical protein DRI90_27615 [Deltaproteobacteria bacterium]